MFSVGDRVPDDVLEEDLEDTTGLFVDETGDTLHTTTTSETTNSRLGDTCGTTLVSSYILPGSLAGTRTLDVVTKNLAMTLSTTLSETLQHDDDND